MADEKRFSLILGNATRLLNDARLLVDHHRYASAFALAVLGVEEIGKLLLKGWEAEKPLAEPKGRTTAHVRKQAAVAALLLGAKMARMFPNGVDWSTLDVDAVTKDFNESDEGYLFRLIRESALDRRKQNALYQDDDALTAVEDNFAEMQVGGIFRIATEAQEALASQATHAPARAFYEIILTS
jgi:AbiV family abortive infection protein